MHTRGTLQILRQTLFWTPYSRVLFAVVGKQILTKLLGLLCLSFTTRYATVIFGPETNFFKASFIIIYYIKIK